MRNTYNDLSNKKKDLPEVEVLLATFNGEPFLGEFLNSLSLQEGVRVHLRVSDDGSTDKTLEIVRSYENRFESCNIFIGPGESPSANFFSLIERATCAFVALADQDDLWEKEKLSTQISFMVNAGPQLVCHDRSVINSNSFKIRDSQITVRLLDLSNALTENVVFGNTILLNQSGINLIRNYKSSNVIMYDSYLYLIFSCFGKVTFIQKSLTKYRIHSQNVIGLPTPFVKLKNFKINLSAFYKQAKVFFDLYGDRLSKSDAEILKKYLQLFETKNQLLRIILVLLSPLRRQKKVQTWIWKILIIIQGLRRLDFANFMRKSLM